MSFEFKIVGKRYNGEIRELAPIVSENGNVIIVTLPKSSVSEVRFETVRIESSLTTAKAGDNGYMFYPTNFGCGFVTTHFKDRVDASFTSWLNAPPVCGICENENAVFVRADGQSCDVRFVVETKDNVYNIIPEFVLDGDIPDDDISVVYTRMPNATYSDMAKVYRKYQMEYKGCVPLRERVLQRETLRRAAASPELRIRMGWKPIPTPVRQQTLKNEPPMKIACDIATLNKLVDSFHAKGIENLEICLVGWGPCGHDGRFPQQYPSDERFGGDDELRKFIAKAQKMGYLVVCHTVSCGGYEIANNWDRDLTTKKIGPNGDPIPFLRTQYSEKGLNGGDPWHICAKTAYEHYAKEDLPVVRGYGYQGMHYVDELTATYMEKCYDKEHPVTRKQAREYYRKIAQLSKNLFGGYQSEAYMDYMNSDVDAILYTGVTSKLPLKHYPLFDEAIPFWQLVYHGIVMSNATSQTVNYPIKSAYENLKLIEWGGRPLLYINSKFGEDRNWMGDLDLHCNSDEEIEKSAEAVKKAFDEYEQLKHLQYEFMENHEKVADGVFKVTYSDGTVITVDYNVGSYTITK
jgi:hypothetical protein